MTVAISTEVARLAQEAVQDGTLSNVYQVCAIARGASGCEWDCIQEKLVLIRARDPERFARLTHEVNLFGASLSPDEAFDKITQQVMYLACEYRADELETAHRLPTDFKQRFMHCD